MKSTAGYSAWASGYMGWTNVNRSGCPEIGYRCMAFMGVV